MRACDPLLAAALADGSVRLWRADIFDITLADASQYFWTSYDLPVTVSGTTYQSLGQNLQRSKWNVVNTMQIPELELTLLTNAAPFAGGADLISQIHNGLLDGAKVLFRRLYMPGPTDTSLGPVVLFSGEVATVDVEGLKMTIKVRGANNRLDQNAPRNVFQVGCLHAFCDDGCTLLRATYTSSFTVGSSPTRTFVPWSSPPASPSLFQLGTLTMTSGTADGESRTIEFADASGVTLSYPLYSAPAPGDTFDAFQGCDKTRTTCNLPSRSNIQNWRGFPFIPPATTAI